MLTASDITRSSEDSSTLNGSGGVSGKDVSIPSGVFDQVVHMVKFDPDSILNCPHDFPHHQHNDLMDLDDSRGAGERADGSGQSAIDMSSGGDTTRSVAVNLADLFIKPCHFNLSLPDSFQVNSQKLTIK